MDTAVGQAEWDALRAEVAALRRQIGRRKRQDTWQRRVALVIVAALMALVPLGLFAASFTDLNAGSPHNGNINAIADAGITKGCNPPDNDQYCPNDLVTREQMASFLARTAGLGGNPPVANALTAQTAANANHASTADTATSATNATNALQLGEQPASAYLQKAGLVAFEVSPLTAVAASTPLTLGADTNGSAFLKIRSSAIGEQTVFIPVDFPSNLLGLPLKVTSFRVCYTVSSAATAITTLAMGTLSDIGTSLPATHVMLNATSITCTTITPPNPPNLAGVPHIRVAITFNDPSHVVYLGRITVTGTTVP